MIFGSWQGEIEHRRRIVSGFSKPSFVSKKIYQARWEFPFSDRAFPDAKHPPSLSAQCGVDFPISRPVFPELFLPKCFVSLRFGISTIMAVPKTTIRKNGDPIIRKHEIGFSELDIIFLLYGDLSLRLVKWSNSYYWVPLPMKGVGYA